MHVGVSGDSTEETPLETQQALNMLDHLHVAFLLAAEPPATCTSCNKTVTNE